MPGTGDHVPPYTTPQSQAFIVSSNFSQGVGPSVQKAIQFLGPAISELRDGIADAAEAEADLREALQEIQGQFDSMLRIAKWGGDILSSRMISTAEQGVRQGYNALALIGPYRKDVEEIEQSGTRILSRIRQKQFIYNRSKHLKHRVDSCSDLRAFDLQMSNSTSFFTGIVQQLWGVSRVLRAYGDPTGKQRRNQTKQLITGMIHTVNDMMTSITSVMRNGMKVKTLRIFIDVSNDSYCGQVGGTKYIGPASLLGTPASMDPKYRAPMTREDHANSCDGLNQLSGLMRLVAKKQGRSWTDYRQRWNRLSNSDKDRNIVEAFSQARNLLKGLRDRKLPKARARFVDLFRGMAEVGGQSDFSRMSPREELAALVQWGPIAKASMSLNKAIVQAANAKVFAIRNASLVSAVINPSNVQCQSGSGYAGIFGGDDGEPMNPMLAVGGGLVAGVAVAHFLPNLLMRR